MNKERIKKLAGINEGTAFRNGKFKLDRYKVGEDAMFGGLGDLHPNGDWCDADDVAGLEDIAAEIYAALDDIIGEAGFEGLPDSKQDAIHVALKKAKSL